MLWCTFHAYAWKISSDCGAQIHPSKCSLQTFPKIQMKQNFCGLFDWLARILFHSNFQAPLQVVNAWRGLTFRRNIHVCLDSACGHPRRRVQYFMLLGQMFATSLVSENNSLFRYNIQSPQGKIEGTQLCSHLTADHPWRSLHPLWPNCCGFYWSTVKFGLFFIFCSKVSFNDNSHTWTEHLKTWCLLCLCPRFIFKHMFCFRQSL